jgi:hypothetical protein
MCTGADTALQRRSHLCIPRKGIAWPQSQFPHIHVSVTIYIFPESVHILSCRRILGIYKSLTNECAIPFLGIFFSNFRYCVFAARVETGSYLMKSPPSETVYSFSLTAYLKRYLHGTNTLIRIIPYYSYQNTTYNIHSVTLYRRPLEAFVIAIIAFQEKNVLFFTFW